MQTPIHHTRFPAAQQDNSASAQAHMAAQSTTAVFPSVLSPTPTAPTATFAGGAEVPKGERDQNHQVKSSL